jgi:6-phosphogluconate dehydrogenase
MNQPVPGSSTGGGAAVRAELGVVGLGVMGRNLLLHLADVGFRVAGYDREAEKVAALREEARHREIALATSLPELVGDLRRPRAVLLLVPAGGPVDAVLEGLVPLLDRGDLVIDGGNSHFTDTDRRGRALAERGLLFMGLGISGGAHGARHGASLMPGGPREAWERVSPLLEAAAARVDGERCVTWLGPGSAGHYVKMVHNGIEYGLMQLIAEIHDLASRGLGLSSEATSRLFEQWNATEVGAYLVGITARILAVVDEKTGRPLLEMIRDVARQKGTGQWTSQDALALQVPTPTIDAAVGMRDLSALAEREEIRRALVPSGASPTPRRAEPAADGELLRRALFAGMLLTFAQGFSLLRAASLARDYQLRLQEVASIWRGGCIIRARLLEPIAAAYRARPDLPSLLADPALAGEVRAHHDALVEVVGLAARLELPAPGLMASSSYLEALRSARLPTNLIQAQRDCFGAHTYERIDAAGNFHTEWMPT